jgi:hypothetical protein
LLSSTIWSVATAKYFFLPALLLDKCLTVSLNQCIFMLCSALKNLWRNVYFSFHILLHSVLHLQKQPILIKNFSYYKTLLSIHIKTKIIPTKWQFHVTHITTAFDNVTAMTWSLPPCIYQAVVYGMSPKNKLDCNTVSSHQCFHHTTCAPEVDALDLSWVVRQLSSTKIRTGTRSRSFSSDSQGALISYLLTQMKLYLEESLLPIRFFCEVEESRENCSKPPLLNDFLPLLRILISRMREELDWLVRILPLISLQVRLAHKCDWDQH